MSGIVGIYILTCEPTKKVYVGQTTNFPRRKSAHLAALQHNRHYNFHLQSAVDKYGIDKFTWEFFECGSTSLTEMEQWALDQSRGI